MKFHKSKEQLEEMISSDIEDMLKHRTIHLKDGPMMYVSGNNAVYTLSDFHHMGFHNRDNQCFYSRKHDMTFFCIHNHGSKYRIIGAFDGDCILSDYVTEK